MNEEFQSRKTCLFAVNGTGREVRRRRIAAIAALEPSIGFIVSVFDFEWMIRRAILALSGVPTPEIKKYFKGRHGLDAYKDAWTRFVYRTKRYDRLPAIFDKECRIPWCLVKQAFEARHPIVHGSNGFIKDDDAIEKMNCLLNASDAIEDYLKKFGKTAFERIFRRKSQKGK